MVSALVKRIQKKERERKERKKQRKIEKKEKMIAEAKERKAEVRGKKFVKQKLVQKIFVTAKKEDRITPTKKREKPKVIKIPTKETLRKRTPQEIQQELRGVKIADPKLRQLVAKGFKQEEAKEKLKIEAQQRLAQKLRQQKVTIQPTPKEELIRKVFRREPIAVPEKLQIQIKKPIQLQKQGTKALVKLGFQEGNIKKFISKVTEQRKQKARAREELIDNSVQSFIRRTNLQDTEQNKDTIKQAVKTIGIELSELDRINNVTELQNRITDFTTEGLFRYGISVMGLDPNEIRQFARNRDIQGLTNKIKQKVSTEEKKILFEKGLTDLEKANKLANFYQRTGIAKNITLNKIPYYVVTKDGKLKSAFEKLDPVSINNNNKFLRNVISQRNLKTVPVGNIGSSSLNKISKWIFSGIELANRGANTIIVKREVNFDSRITSPEFAKDIGKFLLNIATAVPRTVKKGLFLEIDTLTKKSAKNYKKVLLQKGFDDPETKERREALLRIIKAKQRALEDIRSIDPSFNENSNIIFDQDVVDTALLLVGAPLISKGIAKLGLGAKTLARSQKPMVSLIGRWSGKGIKAGEVGFVGTQVGMVAIKPDVENISNLLLIGGNAIRGSTNLIKKLTKVKLKKTSKLKAEITKKNKELKEKGISPRERQFKEVQELNLLKQKLINLESKEISLIERLKKLIKVVSLNRGKIPTKNQQNLIKNIKRQSKSIKTNKKKVEQKLEDFKKKIKKKPEKKKSTQKEIRERLDKIVKEAKKTGKKTKVKNLLLFVKAINRPSIMKIVKSDLKKQGFKFNFKKSKETGKTFVDFKKIGRPKKKEIPKAVVKLKARAKEKKIIRELERKPRKERVTKKRLIEEVERQKRLKQRASEKATKEDIEKAITVAIKKNISFREEIILGVKKSSLTKKQIDDVVDDVIGGIKNPKIIENIKKRFDNQIKQIQTRKVVLKQQLNKMIGFSQITEKGFTVLKKKARKVIPKIKKSLNDLDIELKRINNSKSEFFKELKKNKLDIVKTSKQLDELKFARRQKEFREIAKKKEIIFERDFSVKPQKDEATMKVFLGKKLGTIEIFFKTPKTRGFRPTGKKAQLRPSAIFKEPIIKFKHKSFNPKQIELVKSRAAKQIMQDPRKRRADNLFTDGKKQRRKIALLSKPRKGLKLSQTSKRRTKRLNRDLDLIEERVKRLRLNAIGLAIANTFGFDTSNLRKTLDLQIPQIAKVFKDIQTNINDLEKKVIKEFKEQQEKKRKIIKKAPVKKITPIKKLPPKIIRKPTRKPKRKIIRKPIKKIEKKKLRVQLLTWETKLPKGFRLSFNAFFRERKNPKLPQHPRTNPVRKQKIIFNLPLNRALKAIATGVDRTNPRSFKLQISGITKKKDIPKPTQLLKKYRFRRTKNALDSVEKSKFAIDTRGEKKGLALARYVKKTLRKKPQIIRKKRSKPKTTRKRTKTIKRTKKTRKVLKRTSKRRITTKKGRKR